MARVISMLSSQASFKQQYGPWAIVAGGSEGIGLAFAELLAKQGVNLVLVSRNEQKLSDARSVIRRQSAVDLRCISADLSHEDSFSSIIQATTDIEIGLLVYNAGAVHGADFFLDQSVESAIDLVNLNCHGPVLLAHHFGRLMRDRQRGGMIFLSSMAALAGGSYITTYAATKSFDIVFAQSLWHELKADNINVLGLIAGATATPAMAASGFDIGQKNEEGLPVFMSSSAVAKEGLDNLENGPIHIVGDVNRASADAFNQLSREQLVNMMSQATAELYNKPS